MVIKLDLLPSEKRGVFSITRKGPSGPCYLLRRGCVPGATRGQPRGVNFSSQGVISRRFKRKKNFVTDERTNKQTEGGTDVMVEIVI